jgi:phage repressor protein C with HTH and peptisase S24 domain
MFATLPFVSSDRRPAYALRPAIASFALARVSGTSMQPTLHDGEVLLVRKGRRPRRGDIAIVVLAEREGVAVKRITDYREDGWWVERDNPAEGTDSWLVGAIPDGNVLAVAVARLWPLRRIGRLR